MTPKEKAKELVEKMYFSGRYKDGEDYIPEQALIRAKECALIAVNEILNENSIRENDNDEIITYEPYWLKVKQEIEKL